MSSSREGVICVAAPNDFSPVQDILRSTTDFPARWVAPPERLNYFSKESLGRLVARSGFAVTDWTGQYPIDLAMITGVNHVSELALDSQAHRHRISLDRMRSTSNATRIFGKPVTFLSVRTLPRTIPAQEAFAFIRHLISYTSKGL